MSTTIQKGLLAALTLTFLAAHAGLAQRAVSADEAEVRAEASRPASINRSVVQPIEQVIQAVQAKSASHQRRTKNDEQKIDAQNEEEGEEEETAGPPSVTRRSADSISADPAELKLSPDEQGRLQFYLRGQKWVDVLQLLADWSGLALDWTELPGDAVNFTTNKKYTLEEARDVFNRMLLDRGYTMLVQPALDTLSVQKLDNLNPATVPRLRPEELDEHSAYEWAKVSFPLSHWLDAEDAVKDFEHMKSDHGTLKPLNATNRLEAVDTVLNLRQLRDVLSDEVSSSRQKTRIGIFPIRYRNAADVAELLRSLLGLQSKSQPAAPMTPQQMQQMRRRLAQMRAQQQQNNKGAPTLAKEPKVHLVVNRRENTIIANAPLEQMAIIDQAIQAIDVPSANDRSLPANVLRIHSYKLASMDPEPLVKILKDIGNLDVHTRLEVDTKNNAIVAYARLADHMTIRTLIDKLDGSGREFHVIPLRRLRADDVAGTIAFMMGIEQQNEENRPRYYYWPSRREEEEDTTNKFAVDADIENNWLLVRANQSEYEEIENLLVQLGEIRRPGSNQSTVRYLPVPSSGPATEAMLERIRRIWPSVAPNELKIEVPATTTPPEATKCGR